MSNRAVIALRNAPLLLRGIYEYNVGHRLGALRPREWMFPVTYRCNARCAMCNIWQGEKTDELTVDEWGHVISDPLFVGIESINVTGGEPTLLRDLPALTTLLVDRLPSLRRITLTSNGLRSERVLRKVGGARALFGVSVLSKRVGRWCARRSAKGAVSCRVPA